MERILVTGATGFLGGAVARRLVAEGTDVVGLGRNARAGAALERDGVRFARVDLADRHELLRTFEDIDVVIHCAALSSVWGSYDEFWRCNVLATEHVLQAAREHGVKRLVHVSTPSIYHNGQDRHKVAENAPLPARAINAYADTKRRAEELVDQAQAGGLRTVTLRPRGLFGPGDPSVLPRLIRALQSGHLPILGSGHNLVDVTYIDNAVDAVLLAAKKNVRSGARYNITNGEPIHLWSFIDRLARALALPRTRGRLPRPLATTAARFVEWVHRRFLPNREPLLTRYGVDLLSLSMTLDISRARYELGYDPKISVSEGLERFAAHWQEEQRQ